VLARFGRSGFIPLERNITRYEFVQSDKTSGHGTEHPGRPPLRAWIGIVNSEHSGAVREGRCVIIEGMRRGGIDARESDSPSSNTRACLQLGESINFCRSARIEK
jgi:hypothetical protein